MTRWKHRLEVMDLAAGNGLPAARFLDELGAQGWEVVGFTPWKASSHGLRVETNAYVVLLKRPLDG
jgi:predicted nicotinamide N-methyase